jgi:multicomponent K+:H+ antiporter subunit E
MIRRLFPHPVLSVVLALGWLLLNNAVTMGHLVLGAALGAAIALFIRPWWPGQPRIRNLPALAAYTGLVVWDILIANFAVARIVLFMRREDIRSSFIAVPLELTSPEGIAVLAATITLTPGTVSADLSACGRALLVHALHAPEPDAVRHIIKSRYEARLKRIFT